MSTIGLGYNRKFWVCVWWTLILDHSKCIDQFGIEWSDFSQISLREYFLLQINEKIFSQKALEGNFLVIQKFEKDEGSFGFFNQ